MSRFLRASQDVSNGVRNIIFPKKNRSHAPKNCDFFLKGLRPSRSDLGPISGRTPPVGLDPSFPPRDEIDEDEVKTVLRADE